MLKAINEFLPLITAVIIAIMAYFVLRTKEIIRAELKEFKKDLMPEIGKEIELKLANHIIDDLEKKQPLRVVGKRK